jgi:hypothetical protein
VEAECVTLRERAQALEERLRQVQIDPSRSESADLRAALERTQKVFF